MSGIIPDATIDSLRRCNDLAVDIYGIPCTVYIPNNLDDLESSDAYTDPDDIVFDTYGEQKVWIEWFAKDIVKLRKLGLFTENEAPITCYLKNSPEVTIKSYITVPVRYIPDTYDTDDFEVVDVIQVGTYNCETIRRYKLAPLRKPES